MAQARVKDRLCLTLARDNGRGWLRRSRVRASFPFREGRPHPGHTFTRKKDAMSEESILILNMLREGKITAEQADALLRAVRETAPPSQGTAPPPPPAPVPPSAPNTDPATLAAMQNKLADLQTKLGDLQGKLGAAQAARAAGQAASFAGKVLDHLPRPDVDMGRINKTVDEALRGLTSFKNDAVRAAKVAGRQAAQEARRAAKQGRKAMHFDLTVSFGDDDRKSARPANSEGQPSATETTDTPIHWNGAALLSLANAYGSIKVVGTEDAGEAGTAKLVKTAWAATDAEARVLLQQIFLTSTTEGGKRRVEVVAPADAQGRITVDYELTVPRALMLEMDTTFGDISAEGASALLTAQTVSGRVSAQRPFSDAGGAAHLSSRSGDIALNGWNAPSGTLTVETVNGDIGGEGVTCQSAKLSSRSGDVTLAKLQTVASCECESVSGDVSLTGGAVGTRLAVKTQSGGACVQNLRATALDVETVSGDAELVDTAATAALTVKTISGDIDAKGISSPAASVSTVSGDARWAFAAPFSGSLAGTTVSGDMALSLWTNSDTRVELSTTSGDLRCDLPLADAIPADPRHLSGKVGEGTGSIKLQSVSGDLTVNAQS